jgi:hypothetical protein
MSSFTKQLSKFTSRINKRLYSRIIALFTIVGFIMLSIITVLLIKSSGRPGSDIDDNSTNSCFSQSLVNAYPGTSTSENEHSNQVSYSFTETESDSTSVYENSQFFSSDGGKSGSSRSSNTGKYSSRQSSTQQTDYIPLGIESAKGEKIMDDTVEYFSNRTSFLSKSLSESSFYFIERLLDETTQTRAFIIARDENYALNLNGYFYYLLDRTSSSDIVSPFVLNISVLFDESSREEVCRSEEYAQRKHLNALKNSLSAALGRYYTEEVYEFIYEGYKETFAGRINGQPSKASLYKLKVNDLEIIFHNSFLTYIEFYIVKK